MKHENKMKFGDFILNNKALFILTFLIIILSCSSPVFLTQSNIFNVIRQVAIGGIVSLGFTVIMASGCMDLSVGNMLSMIGVIIALLAKIEGMPLIVACLIGIVVGIICGCINATVSTVFNLAPFIVTLAMSQVYNGAAHLISNGKPVSNLPESLVTVGQGYVGIIPIPVIILFAATFVLYLFLAHTRIGRHILAIGGNSAAARVSGVNVNRTKLIAYVIMGACVALAAIIMDGRAASAQVAAGAGMEMDAIAAVVIGGISKNALTRGLWKYGRNADRLSDRRRYQQRTESFTCKLLLADGRKRRDHFICHYSGFPEYKNHGKA